MGEWRYSSTILDLGTIQRSVVSFMSQPLFPWGKSPQYLMDRKLVGPQSQYRHCRIEKNFFHCQELNPSHPAHSILLCQLSYPSSQWNVCCSCWNPMRGNDSEFPTESDAFDQHAKETIILNLQDYGCYYMLESVHETLRQPYFLSLNCCNKQLQVYRWNAWKN
jgi:hypothetical protein